MRISDWSSDVCSSDLGTASGQRLLHDRQVGAAPLRAGLAVAEDPLELPGATTAADDGARLLDLRAGYRPQRRLPGAEGGALGQPGSAQTGRASGRERGVHTSEHTGGAVTTK